MNRAIQSIISTTRKAVGETYHRKAPDSAIVLSLATQVYLLKKYTRTLEWNDIADTLYDRVNDVIELTAKCDEKNKAIRALMDRLAWYRSDYGADPAEDFDAIKLAEKALSLS